MHTWLNTEITKFSYDSFYACGGTGGMVLQYFQIYVGLEHYFGFKFQKNEYFLGYEESVDIFWWVITK